MDKRLIIIAIILAIIAFSIIIYRKMKKRQESKILGCDNLNYDEFDSGATPDQIKDPNIETYYSKARKRWNVAGTGKANMKKEFLEPFCKARKLANVPFVINSGYRTPEYNSSKKVKGVKGSSHTRGYAADIKTPKGKNQEIIVKALRAAGFVRFGVYTNFIHVDNDPIKPKYAHWGTAKHRFNPFKLNAA